ncbi:DNA-directed RNA polymerase I subunit RPA49-like isoform X1 [Diorhabda carinulata]|uniref:DNA-directed RNA polymerase I subunit RPA49-like isoform X1 n=1 Tax=Diorhabda sublineata TaxID=1163346 RepID=UPI0024E04E55|nr:DNA-directed RNA polymerase I subunit RPA49-like isoform X1 [Diorhabda sublineata]XP_057656293.1 DNA-directed RNA polymerase I subunit RPA49-like isoform X1 [Diorhabda carinulata]
MSMMTPNIDYNNQALSWRILPLKKSLDSKNTDIHTVTGETLTIQFNDTGHLTDIGNSNYQIVQNEQPKYPTQCNMQVVQQSYIQEPPKLTTQFVDEVKPPQNKVKHKKKIHRLPIDGTLYHSQQLGLKVPPKKTLGTRGRIIESQAREVIHNVFKFMRDEAQNGIKIPISNYRERVLRATGISKCTYYKITTREFKRGGPQPTKRKKNFVAGLGNGLKVDNVEQVVENESIYRPKINRDASSPDGVYNLEDLVEAYILDTLAVEAGKIIEAGSADQFGFCKFVTTNMNKLLTSNISEEDKIRSLTIFLYIHYLIVYIKTPMKSITKKFVVCDKSVDINNHILKVFSEVGANGSRTRPLHMKDKALCYTMILAAIAMEFEVDVELLSKDLKIGMKKVVEVARILAFNMKANNKNIVQLKLPLPAPVAYSPKKGRR